MRRAIDLATNGLGYVSTNPAVGSIIVYKDRIIGEGFHKKFGGAHAEINALEAVQKKDHKLLPFATMYITLEPCFHYGKTPPCVDQILKGGIKRVVISCKDPNEKVAGKSIKKLRAHGVEVKLGILKKEGIQLIRHFSNYILHKKPFVILKFARTADGFMGQANLQIWISSKASKRLVHKWRHEVDAIMVGTNTALLDNPQLTNRYYFGQTPKRIVLDRKGRLTDALFLLDQSIETIVITSIHQPDRQNIRYWKMDFSDPDFLNQILIKLYENQIQTLIVEGGAQLIQSFVNHGLWNEARVLEGRQNISDGIKSPDLGVSPSEKYTFDTDKLLIYRP